ncbi:PQQ-binding-like beta-propeller repeat protein [Dokdonia sp.]|uniref:outer membrane protein assembly factor BamB family protein n=1 Tax=Dokdonia sp. TaxID=2024995 RepID=UPI003267B665
MKATKLLEYKLKGERNISSKNPILDGDHLYCLFTYNKNYFESRIICLTKNSFEVVWEYKYPFIMNNLIIHNKILFACTMDGVLLELDAINGKLLSSNELNIDRCGRTSEIYNDLIAVGGIQGTKETTCFSLSDKKIKWTKENNGHSSIPLIIQNSVLQCAEHQITCFDLDSGKQVWNSKEKRGYVRNPIYFKSSIVVGGKGHINFYNLKNGKLEGQYSEQNMGSISRIIAHKDCLYFGDSIGNFYGTKIFEKKNVFGKIKYSAKKLWEYNSSGTIESLPVLNESKVLFINDDNKLICLDRFTGELVWLFNTKAEAGVSGLVLDKENVFVSVAKGHVYKIKLN